MCTPDLLHALDAHRMLAWAPHAAGGVRATLRWAARHTGLPVVVVAAFALVASWRIFRRAARLTVELAVALVLLLGAARMGWIRW